ncbi:hypothetical protein ACOSQ2_014193 [Xanthoceras sorbifolium]
MTSSLTPVSGTTSPSVGCRLPLANSSSTTAESLASSVSTLCCPACNSLCPASKASRRAALFRTIVGNLTNQTSRISLCWRTNPSLSDFQGFANCIIGVNLIEVWLFR